MIVLGHTGVPSDLSLSEGKGGKMFESVRKWLTVGVALVALLGFLYFFGGLVITALLASQKPSVDTTLTSLATILSGLVGGIVAAGFGQKPPNPPGGGRRWRRNFSALGNFVQGGLDWGSKEFIGSVYAIVYVVLGVLAIYCAYFRSDLAPDLLKNLANVTLGLFIAIITAFFSSPS
jgi:hypothetical protein